MRIDTRAFARSAVPGMFACLATAALVIASPSAARAACAQWNINGAWNFHQDNNFTVTFNIKQVGDRLTGWGNNDVFNPIKGTIAGNHFSFTANWGAGQNGVYEGQIGPQGEMSGTTSGVGWHDYYGKAGDLFAGNAAAALGVGSQGQAYAATAASVIGQARQLACGYDGARWSLQEDHRKWCVGLGDNYRTAAGVETDARATGLADCRTKIATAASHRPPLESKPILHDAAPVHPGAGAWDARLHRFLASPPK